MADSVQGNLHHEIMQIGMHDGDIASDPSLYKNHDLKHETVIETESERAPTTSQAYRDSTNRLVALVEELTTSEAADVIEQINKPPSSNSTPEKWTSGSSNKNISSNSALASGSSNAKSGEKSISSEGISTGAKAAPVTKSDLEPERPISDPISENVPVPVTLGIAEFLEPTGTTISLNEANGLEKLLRDALIFLPELRVTPLELAKQHWFQEQYQNVIHTHQSLLGEVNE